LRVCGAFGVLLGIVGMSALYGMWNNGRGKELEEARSVEDKIYNAKLNSGEIDKTPEKRSEPATAGEAAMAAANKETTDEAAAPATAETSPIPAEREQAVARETDSPASEIIEAGSD
jgi:hypothetical protein